MKATFNLDADLHKQLKQTANALGMPMSVIVQNLIEGYVRRMPAPKKRSKAA